MRRTPLFFFLFVGCRAPDPAPTDLDELAHFFFAQAQEQDHERIVEGAANLEAWYEGSGLAGLGPSGGALSDLLPEEVEALDELRWSPDPARCAAVYAVSEIPCDLEAASTLNLEADQLAVFEDSYQSYERTWDTDPACYSAGTCDAVDWTSSIVDGFVGSWGEMHYEMVVKLRRSRDAQGQPAVMLIRSIMPEMAQEDVDAGGFEQSYHIEVYLARDAGILHFYGLWNHGTLTGFDDDADLWPSQYLKGLVDFEEALGEVCVNGW